MDERDVTLPLNRMASPDRRGPGRPKKSPTAEVVQTAVVTTLVKCSHCGSQFKPAVLRTVPYDDGKRTQRKTRCPSCGTWQWIPDNL